MLASATSRNRRQTSTPRAELICRTWIRVPVAAAAVSARATPPASASGGRLPRNAAIEPERSRVALPERIDWSPGDMPTSISAPSNARSPSATESSVSNRNASGTSAVNSSTDTGARSSIAGSSERSRESAAWKPTSTCSRPSAIAIFAARYSAVDVQGSSVGMSSTVVTPPSAAAWVPERKSSLCVRPGSRRCACASISPGRIRHPIASIVAAASWVAPGGRSAAMRPPVIATSARRIAPPSTTVPPTITFSNTRPPNPMRRPLRQRRSKRSWFSSQ